MAGFAVSIAHNIYPAEFAQISRNLTNQQQQAAQAFLSAEMRANVANRSVTIDTEHMKADPDRDADGHDWGPPSRRRRREPPEPSTLETLAGEGSVFDLRA